MPPLLPPLIRAVPTPDPQVWLRTLQEEMQERVGEPVLFTIRMAFDEWFEVEISTFTDRWGTAAGANVAAATEDAVQMLLEMDEVVGEIERRNVSVVVEDVS